MRCYAHLYFYYNEKEDKIKISHCFLDRDFSVIGEIDRNEFYSLSENQFYEYLKSIVFTKPILCDGINCNEIWKSLDYKIGRIDVAISRQCNLSCPMCYAQDGGHKDSPIRKKLYLDVIDKLKNFEFDELRLTDWG